MASKGLLPSTVDRPLNAMPSTTRKRWVVGSVHNDTSGQWTVRKNHETDLSSEEGSGVGMI